MIKNLKEHKEKKHRDKEARIAKLISEDFQVVLKTLNLTIDALSFYKKYIPVMEVLSTVQTNKTLIEIHLKKYEKQLDEASKLEIT